MAREIETIINNFASDGQMNLGADPSLKALDISFDNVGTSTVTITNIGTGGSFTLLSGDPMVTYGGYDNAYRVDNFKFSFTGGAGLLNIFVTREK